MYSEEFRRAILQEMIDSGDLIGIAEDMYEDMGGHVIHESNIGDIYIDAFLEGLSRADRREVVMRLTSEPQRDAMADAKHASEDEI